MKTPGKTSENPSHIYYEMTLWDWKYWNSLTVGQTTSTISKPLKQKFHRFSSPPLLFKDSSSIKAQTLAGPTDHLRGIRGLLIWKKWVESVSSTPNLWTGYFRRSLQNKRQLHIHFSLEEHIAQTTKVTWPSYEGEQKDQFSLIVNWLGKATKQCQFSPVEDTTKCLRYTEDKTIRPIHCKCFWAYVNQWEISSQRLLWCTEKSMNLPYYEDCAFL